MLSALGHVAHVAVGLAGSPFTILGLVPIFAAGLAFMKYVDVDPETHPVNVKHVSLVAVLSNWKKVHATTFVLLVQYGLVF